MQVKVAERRHRDARLCQPDTARKPAGGVHAPSRSGTAPRGVFESSQDPIIVGQAAYNSAYGTNFVQRLLQRPDEHGFAQDRRTSRERSTTLFDTFNTLAPARS